MFAIENGAMYGLCFAAVVFLITLALGKNVQRSIWCGVGAFAPTVFLTWLIEYFGLPSHTGFLGGYGYVVFTGAVAAFVSALVAGSSKNSDSKSADSGLLGLIAGVTVVGLVGIYFVTWLYCAVGTENNKRYADLGNITVAPAGTKPQLPDTDPNEMVTMDVHLAWTKAHTALGSGGNNLGSYYEVLEDEGVQQWVGGRNWIVFPLELNGWMEQVGFLTQQISCSAGYIAVPADDPDGQVKIINNLCLKYMPDSSFSLNLNRYLYTHGYSDGQLIDPTIEADDDWHIYFTVAYVQPAFTVGGPQVVKVLVVDPANGDIQSYDPDKVPAWVDRVNSDDMVGGWVGDFAKYGKNPNFWNSNNAGQMKIDTKRLINVKGQHQVWQVPLLANKDNATSTNGIVLYDTREHKGTFYEAEGASGLGSSAVIKAAFENIQQNTRGWHVDHIQYYYVQNVATWMAIYAKEVSVSGGTRTEFAGIGFLEASDTNPSDVSFATNLQDALAAYKVHLAAKNRNAHRVDEKVTTQSVTGAVLRIGHDTTGNNQVFYTIVMAGNPRVFQIPLALSPLLPDVEKGDIVSLTFGEPSSPDDSTRSVTGFDDQTLAAQMKANKN